MALPMEIFYHELEVGTKITMIVFCFLFAIMFWNRSRSADLKSARMTFLGQGLFLFAFGITRILFIIADYFRADPEYTNIVIEANAELNFLLWKISSAVGVLAIIFLLFVIETYLVNTKYVLTLIATVGLVFALALPDIDHARLATYISMPVALGGVIGLYAYLFFKSSGDIRQQVSLSLDGFIIFGVGVALDTSLGRALFSSIFKLDPSWQLAWFPVVLMIVGLAIYTYYNIKRQ